MRMDVQRSCDDSVIVMRENSKTEAEILRQNIVFLFYNLNTIESVEVRGGDVLMFRGIACSFVVFH